MTADLFTRLACRAIGEAGRTTPALEPEPVLDDPVRDGEDAVEPGGEPDAPPVPDAVPAVRAATPSPDQAAAGPAPSQQTPVLLPVPGAGLRPDSVPDDDAPAVSWAARPAAAAAGPPPQPLRPAAEHAPATYRRPEAGRPEGPADTAAAPPRPTGPLRPSLLPVIESSVPGPDRRPAAAADQRTSVEVTIGRIEIRVRPPVPGGTAGSRRAVSPEPALTLEEYLRRREPAP